MRIAIVLLLAAAFVVAFATTTPKPWMLACIGLVLGCACGYLRMRAAAAGRPARGANVLGWLCAIGLLVLAMAIAEDMFLGAWAAALAGCLFADRASLLLRMRG